MKFFAFALLSLFWEAKATRRNLKTGSSRGRWLSIIHSSDNESSFQDPNTLEEKVTHYATLHKHLAEQAALDAMVHIHVTAGDHWIPGPFFQASAEVPEYGVPGKGDVEIYNAMELMANGLGNHEFDAGIDILSTLHSGASYPHVSVNLDFSNVQLSEGVPPIVIGPDAGPCANVAGQIVKSCWIDTSFGPVGVIGRSPADFFNVIEDPDATLPGLDFYGGRDPATNQPLMSAVPQVLEQVDLLTEAGADIIVLLDHAQDFTGDPLSASSLYGIDIVVAAGSTGFVAQQEAFGPYNLLRQGDESQAQYPLVRSDSNGDTVLVVNSDQLYAYIGHLAVLFDEKGKIVTWDGRSGPIATTEKAVSLLAQVLGYNLGTNEDVDAILEALQATPSIQESFEVIGTTEYPLVGDRFLVRSRATNLGQVVADSTLWAGNEFASSNQLPAIDIGFKNGGGIRDTIDGPSITRLTIRAALAFDNRLALIELTGSQLLAAMENSVSRAPAFDGRFPQVAGIEMTADLNEDPIEQMKTVDSPSRVQSLIINKADGTAVVMVEDGVVVGDLSDTFTVATNSFLLTGGDGYNAFTAATPLGETATGEQEILEDYIVDILRGTVSVVDPPEAPRVVIIPVEK